MFPIFARRGLFGTNNWGSTWSFDTRRHAGSRPSDRRSKNISRKFENQVRVGERMTLNNMDFNC